ncbi:GNAT family N-acetyltransferase [Mesorhizobium sp.]|uniref:GNAT family N-acetyltransferase n=1 Tax=Mesorhizobium sp. TaxID=1871066 RepID=UPI00257B7771|nr:GNAT family N-acetyltransferase [Mesorhizobium sp.]
MSLEVRAASEADFDALVRLNQVVQCLHAELHPDVFKQAADPSAVRTFFAARLADPKSSIAIAEIDRAPVGYVWFEIQSLPETPFTFHPPRIYVHHISVMPEARRRGVATALMCHVEQRAACEGIDEIATGLWAANLDARNFFGSQGCVPFNIALRKKLVRVS